MNNKEKRKRLLLESLRRTGRLDLGEVTALLEISEATGRRLFAELEEEGLCLRVLGGIRIGETATGPWASYSARTEMQPAQKAAISRKAVELVQSGDFLFFDSGTTVVRLAADLSERLRLAELSKISVVTNSLTVVELLASQAKVILLGGETRLDHRDVCGYLAERNLESFQFHRAFLGVDAISLTGGLMTSDERTAKINEIVLTRSSSSYVLADSSKFFREGFMRFAALDEPTGILTDGDPERGVLALSRFREAGAKLVFA